MHATVSPRQRGVETDGVCVTLGRRACISREGEGGAWQGAPLVRVRARALSMSSLTQTPQSHTSIPQRLHPNYQTDAGASHAQMHTQEARRK
jgi:hypothetical protein